MYNCAFQWSQWVCELDITMATTLANYFHREINRFSEMGDTSTSAATMLIYFISGSLLIY